MMVVVVREHAGRPRRDIGPVSFARVRGVVAVSLETGHRAPLNFCRALPGWSTSPRIYLRQEPSRGLSDRLQSLSLGAAHRRQSSRGSFVNVRKGFGEIRNVG